MSNQLMQARAALSKADEPLQVESLSGLPLSEAVSRVASEPRDSIVLFLNQYRDRDPCCLEVVHITEGDIEGVMTERDGVVTSSRGAVRA